MNTSIPETDFKPRQIAVQRGLCAALWLALATQAHAQAPAALAELSFTDLAKTPFLATPSLDQAGGEPVQDMPKPQTGLSLQGLISQGLATNPQLQQAMAQQESAQAQRKVARAELLPSLTLRSATGPEQSQTAGSTVNNHRYNMNSVRMTQPESNLHA